MSQATVRRDAAFAIGVDQLSAEAKEKVLNGQSDAPRSQIAAGDFCARCLRTGPARDCPQCAELRIGVKRKQEAAARKQKPRDNPYAHLPKSVQNALADTWHADSARILSEMRRACKGVFSWSSWLDAAVVDHLRAAEECLLAAVPKKVCPDCEGRKTIEKKQCNKCRGGGYLAAQV